MKLGTMLNMLRDFFSIISNKLLFTYKRVAYPVNFKIRGTLRICGTGNIKIGKNVVINSTWRPNPIGGQEKTTLYVGFDGKIVIGDNVGITNSVITARKGVFIENNVNIGANCKIYDTDFHPLGYIDRINNEDPVAKEVYIKEGAWIGAHCILLKGVTIGCRSVVGAGSVVTKSIPDDEVWGGNPARFIKKLENSLSV